MDTDDSSDERPEDLPKVVGSPSKSRTSRTVSSPSSSDRDSDTEDENNNARRNLNPSNQATAVRHTNLLEPPIAQPAGDKPKALTGKQVLVEVTILKCMKNKNGGAIKTHSKCFNALKKANERILSNGLLADEQNAELRNNFTKHKEEMEGLRRFTREQYNRGGKIVKEKDELKDKLEGKLEREQKAVKKAKKERDEAVDESRELKSENSRLKRKLKSLQQKYDELKAAPAPKASAAAAAPPPYQDKMEIERQRMQMKHEFQVKNDERKEALEEKKEARKRNAKEDRGRIGLSLLGSGGQMNPNFMA